MAWLWMVDPSVFPGWTGDCTHEHVGRDHLFNTAVNGRLPVGRPGVTEHDQSGTSQLDTNRNPMGLSLDQRHRLGTPVSYTHLTLPTKA